MGRLSLEKPGFFNPVVISTGLEKRDFGGAYGVARVVLNVSPETSKGYIT
jgi:hypothetical protein